MNEFTLNDLNLLEAPKGASTFSAQDAELIQDDYEAPALGSTKEQMLDTLDRQTEGPKNLRETFLGEIAKTKEGGTQIYLQSRLNGLRQQMQIAEQFPNDPAVQERLGELRAEEFSTLESLQQAKDLYDTYDKYQREMTPKDEPFGHQVQRSVVASSPGVMAGMAAYLVGGPGAASLVGPGVSASQVLVNSYKKASKFLPHDDALMFAIGDTALEFYGDKLLFSAASKEGRPILDRIIGTMLTGAAEEGATSATQSFHEYVALNPTLTVKEAAQDFAISLASGALMGGGVSLGMGGIEKGQEVLANASAERERRQLKVKLFTELFGDMSTELMPPEDAAIRLLDPGLKKRRPIGDYEVTPSGGPLTAQPEGGALPGFSPEMPLPAPENTAVPGEPPSPYAPQPDAPLFTPYEAYSYRFVDQDPLQQLPRLIEQNPERAAAFAYPFNTQFGTEQGTGTFRYALMQTLQPFLQAGTLAKEKFDAFLLALDKQKQADEQLLQTDVDRWVQEMETRAKEMAASVKLPGPNQLDPGEKREIELLRSRVMWPLHKAHTSAEVLRALEPLVNDPAVRGTVSYFLAKSFSMGGQAAVLEAEDAFQRRLDELAELENSGLTLQTIRAFKGKYFQPVGGSPDIAKGFFPHLSSIIDEIAKGTYTASIWVDPSLTNGAELGKLVSLWLKKFKLPNMRVVLAAVPQGSPYLGQHYDYTNPNGDSIHVIVLHQGDAAKPVPFQEQLLTLAHEFGHALGPELFRNAPANVKEWILADFNSLIRKAMKGNIGDSSLWLRGSADPKLWGPLGLPTADRVAEEVRAYPNNVRVDYAMYNTSGYIFSFEEYFAHRMEKLFLRDFEEMQTPIKVFFKTLWANLKTIWNDYIRHAPDNEMTYRAFIQRHLAEAESRGAEERLNKFKANLEQEIPPAAWAGVKAPSLKTVSEIAESALLPVIPVETPTVEANMGRKIRNFVNKKFDIDPDTSGLDGDLDNFTRLKKIFGNLIILARDNPHIKELSDPSGPINALTGMRQFGYLDLAQMYAQERMRWIQRADERAKEWNWLPRKQKKALAELLFDETLGGTHYAPVQVATYGLTPQALQIYNDIKQDFALFLDEMEQSALQRARQRQANNLLLPQILQDITDKFAQLRAKPYFPLSRFGKHLVIVRVPRGAQPQKGANPGDLLYFEAFDWELQAKGAVKGLKQRFPGMDVKIDVASDVERSFLGVPPQIWEVIRSDLQLTPDQDKRLSELIYRLAPEQRFIKHMMERKKTRGFSQDALRTYAHYFMHGSGHMARTKWGDSMQDAVSRLRRTANEIEGDSTARSKIADYVEEHLNYTLNPGNEWAGLRSVVALAYLWGKLSTAVANLTQVPIFTYPHLAGEYGDAVAWKEILKAMRDIPKTTTATRKLQSWENDALNKYVNQQPLSPKEKRFVDRFYGLTGEERSAVERAVREGFLDESFAMVLAGLANGNMLSRLKATSSLGYYARTLGAFGMKPFEAAEKFNRRVTFLAGYRLQLERSLTQKVPQLQAEEEAFQAGKRAVQASQFEYARWARPEILRGKPGAFLVFMQYQFNALSFMMGGDKGWWRAWAMMLLFGGVFGLPFAEDLVTLASWLLTSSNKKVDVKHEIKQFTEEMLGDAATLVDHGISSVGFGLPFLGDMSGSVSLGRVVPGVDMLTQTSDFNTKVTRGLNDFGGATTALLLGLARSMDSSLPMWKRVELANPIAIGDRMMQSARWLQTGMETTPSGRVVTTFDTDNWRHLVEIGMNAGGFTPRSVTQGEEGRGPGREEFFLRQEMAQFYLARQKALRKAYVEAALAQDYDEVDAARREIEKFNEEVPTGALTITGRSLATAVKKAMKGQMQDLEGGRTKVERAIDEELKE